MYCAYDWLRKNKIDSGSTQLQSSSTAGPWCPHYSLKIPPKKRRRSSKTFRPLSHGSPLSVQVYKRYPEGLGKALYREQFDFNAEPPWDPS
ncbi:hypothetical protein PDJAM_G00138750 [Pangasius djambal]|uniref:Uncharacterized protein n=1 Tax=Pangasius djambal TaxID=1691987 RepID=A0ACC5ZE67_9TELE|nr:hypothetical protein [Pangasius djambal]